MIPSGELLFESHRGPDSIATKFSGLVEVVCAWSLDEVLPALRSIEASVAAGNHAAGFLSYEAAAGVDPAKIGCRRGAGRRRRRYRGGGPVCA